MKNQKPVADLEPREILNHLIHRYAHFAGIHYQEAWRNFNEAFGARFSVPMDTIKQNLSISHGQKCTTPEALELMGLLDLGREVAKGLVHWARGKACA